MRFLQKTFRALLHVEDSPQRAALAFALGVFLGFSPFLGLHTVLGLLVAFLFRLNKLAVLLGVYMNNPWVIVPFYSFSTWFGLQLTGWSVGLTLPNVGLGELFSQQFWEWLLSQWTLLVPAVLGSTILSVLLGLVSYPVAVHILRRFGRKPVTVYRRENNGFMRM